MERVLLELVLSGVVDLDQVISWMTSENSSAELPRAVSEQISTETASTPAHSASVKLLPTAFQAAVLNTVREEAEALFSCIEISSEAATPRHSETGHSPSRARSVSTARISAGCDSGGHPGILDESNFPSLGSARPLQAKQNRLPASALMRMVTPPSASQQSSAASAQSRAGGQPRHRIAPTAVQSLERDSKFLPHPEFPPLRRKEQQRKIAPTKLENGATQAPNLAFEPSGSLTTAQQDSQQKEPTVATRTSSCQGDNKAVCEPGQGKGFRDALLGKGSSPDSQASSGRSSKASAWDRRPVQTWTARAEPNQAACGDKVHAAWEQLLPHKSPASPTSSHGSTSGLTLPELENTSQGSRGPPPSGPETLRCQKLTRSPVKTASGRSGGRERHRGGRMSWTGVSKKQARSHSPSSTMPGSQDSKNSSRGRRESPGATPQSRFRPAATTPATSNTGPEASSGAMAVDRSPSVGSAWCSSPPEHRPSQSPPRLRNREEEIRREQLTFSANGRPGGSPRTPTFAKARVPWTSQSAALASPQDSVYYTASETASPGQTAGDVSAGTSSPENVSLKAKSCELASSTTTDFTAQQMGAKGAAEPDQPQSLDDLLRVRPTPPCALAQQAAVEMWTGASAVEPLSIPSPRQLSKAEAVLARLQAAILEESPEVDLCVELELLVQLLVLPERLLKPANSEAKPQLLGSTEAANAYACRVLEHTGNLVAALGAENLEAFQNCPAVQRHSPKLADACGKGLERSRAPEETQLQGGGSGSLRGWTLLAFTSDGLPKRTPEEQRKVTNREMCRDELLAIMRDASSIGQHLGRPQPPFSAGNEDAAFALIQHRAPAFLRKIAPDSIPHLAELFTAAVLQAAATGEAVLDEQLSSLAKQNISRFQRLNQRLQAPGPRRLQSSPVSSGGGGNNRGVPAQERPYLTNPQSQAWRLTKEGAAHAGMIAAEFPPALRLYILFLEVADSHRLNSALMRCMAVTLNQLVGEIQDLQGGSAFQQLISGTSALAALLSYLCFGSGGLTSAQAERAEDGATNPVLPSLDVRGALRTKATGQPLLLTIQWVTRYLWFLPSDLGSATSLYFCDAVASLSALRQRPELRPSNEGFGSLQLCVRALLDGLFERFHRIDRSALALSDSGEPLLAVVGTTEVDRKLMQCCCPALEHARRSLQAQSAGSRRQARPARVQKITPSIPKLRPDSSGIPEALLAAAEGSTDADQLTLQTAFLDMYSTSEHKVKLRNMVLYVAQIVSHNAATDCIEQCVPPALQQLSSQLQKAAALLNSESSRRVVYNLSFAPIMEQLTSEAILQACSASLERAKKLMHEKVVAALSALSHPSWTPAIAGTAAAIALDLATVACAKRLIAEVPAKVRCLLSANAGGHLRAATRQDEHSKQLPTTPGSDRP